MTTRAIRRQLYEENREYYGYSLDEWKHLDKDIEPLPHKKCTTCHRMKVTSNFTSQYSGKELKCCHFCQNRGFHKYHIDGGVSCSENHGICDTAFLIGTNNHIVSNFRSLDLTKLINKDPIAVLRKQQQRDEASKLRKTKVTCSCGAEVTKGYFRRHTQNKKCIKYHEELKDKLL